MCGIRCLQLLSLDGRGRGEGGAERTTHDEDIVGASLLARFVGQGFSPATAFAVRDFDIERKNCFIDCVDNSKYFDLKSVI